MANYYPFEISDSNGHYLIKAEIESPELFIKYAELFEKFELSGNGYCWAGLITQILEKIDPTLLKHIEFDAEAGAFFANADSKENQIKFVELLSPIFSDLPTLEEYLEDADHSQLDD